MNSPRVQWPDSGERDEVEFNPATEEEGEGERSRMESPTEKEETSVSLTKTQISRLQLVERSFLKSIFTDWLLCQVIALMLYFIVDLSNKVRVKYFSHTRGW